MVQNPGVSGAVNCAAGTYNGAPAHNQWGPDAIGWDLSVLDNIVQNGAAHGITFPCVTTIHQGMKIECDANLWYNYTQDDITISVDTDHTVEACRAGVCGPWQPFSYRNGRQSTWWARAWSDHPHDLRTAKEAR
jgi:hypothetical protein